MNSSRLVKKPEQIEKLELLSLTDMFDFIKIKSSVELLILTDFEKFNIEELKNDIDIAFENTKNEIQRLKVEYDTPPRHHLVLLTFKPNISEQIDNFIKSSVLLTNPFKKDNLFYIEIKAQINIKICELEEIFEKVTWSKYIRKNYSFM